MMHTHRHGKVVSTWRVRRNIAGRDQWSLLDKRDPLIAQHYYPIQDPSMTLVYGDQLAFRCTMVNLGEIVTDRVPEIVFSGRYNNYLESAEKWI